MTDPLEALPPEFPDDLSDAIRAAIDASGRKLIALDDDPTGVQTVFDTVVLSQWDVADLAAELLDPRPVCFVLTNTRSHPEADAVALTREIATNLLEASRQTSKPFVIASRSDSTLRGHFPAETDALTGVLGDIDGLLLVPAFFEGGRYTIDDTHWVRDGERLVPAAETEFARDATFGYTHSRLPAWVEEKSRGRWSAADVQSLSISDIRQGGPDRVAAILDGTADGQPLVVNAASYQDLNVVVLGVLRAEAGGKRFVYRTGAGFVRARAGLIERPLLSRADLVGPDAASPLPGLVIVGSHVARSTEQLRRLLAVPGVAAITLDVPALLNAATRDNEIRRVVAGADEALARGVSPVVATSRVVHEAATTGNQLDISRTVSRALVEVVSRIDGRLGWIVAKGGITASYIGTQALRARRAIVLGQIQAGVPVWQLGPETRYPNLPYVIFPGNVGGPATLAEVVQQLQGEPAD